jgi:hypothetical protein
MRHSDYELLSEAQVERIHTRRKALGLTRSVLLERFTAALKKDGLGGSDGSARMRLDRALNSRMRKPFSETTESALAAALNWTLPEFEQNILRRRGWLRPEQRPAPSPAALNVRAGALAAIELELRRLRTSVEVLAATVDTRLTSKNVAGRKALKRPRAEHH